MSLREKIDEQFRAALKTKNKTLISTFRLILTAIKERDIANRTSGKKEEIKDPEIIKVLRKMKKQRQDSADLYKKGERKELLDVEEAEIKVIDGIPDDLDIDDDNDGLIDVLDSTPEDHDGDGIDDAEDDDDDGDGVWDVVEVFDTWIATNIYDHDNDLIPRWLDLDIDNDGLINWYDIDESGNSTMRDHDNDGNDDKSDSDDDNDAILDVDEVCGMWGSFRYDHDNDDDWDASDDDDDNDGLKDWVESSDGNHLTGQFDHDNDGIPDHEDDDDDNDGILDELEN